MGVLVVKGGCGEAVAGLAEEGWASGRRGGCLAWAPPPPAGRCVDPPAVGGQPWLQPPLELLPLVVVPPRKAMRKAHPRRHATPTGLYVPHEPYLRPERIKSIVS